VTTQTRRAMTSIRDSDVHGSTYTMASPDILLEIRDLSCVKGDNQPIFSNLNFQIKEGEVIILHGRSGAG
jgi:ABC-type transport system involved in cytochrome bd biosynthesis fused ATPase/permease subunit